ncbi:unnamed protein product [Amoebophrya sp. A25]|nr:unnamed protein product [Amoebophrya sp. A25]|eukprot:GSA25T00012292001.1
MFQNSFSQHCFHLTLSVVMCDRRRSSSELAMFFHSTECSFSFLLCVNFFRQQISLFSHEHRNKPNCFPRNKIQHLKTRFAVHSFKKSCKNSGRERPTTPPIKQRSPRRKGTKTSIAP